MKKELVTGVTHLLSVKENKEILSNTVKASTFLTMNYEFVSSPQSLDILIRLMPLLNIFIVDPSHSQVNDKDLHNVSNITDNFMVFAFRR